MAISTSFIQVYFNYIVIEDLSHRHTRVQILATNVFH